MPPRETLLPDRPVDRITRPLAHFLRLQAAGGVVLLVATALALAAANSPLATAYASFWETAFAVRLGPFELSYPLWYWVNDALMTIFFFVIGLEIKRELVSGELRDRRNVVLPAVAALGGAVVPVTVYLLLIGDGNGSSGWAVPMATDIAFVVGCLALLGTRVPAGLKIFMLSLAIIDDILAVVIIAVFFSKSLSMVWLALAVLGFGLIVALQRAGVRHVPVYVLAGSFIWLCTLKSGVHPTVAGAALGFMTPAERWFPDSALLEVIDRIVRRIRGTGASESARHGAVEDLLFVGTESVAPLERLERVLHPWVGFAIMPIFALANAGVAVSMGGLTHPPGIAVLLGLFVGKPLGIVGASWIAVQLGWARLPDRTSWKLLIGAGCLGGIGFTMALFIASLSLSGDELTAAKTGALVGSGLSIVAGLSILWLSLPRRGTPLRPTQPPPHDRAVPTTKKLIPDEA